MAPPDEIPEHFADQHLVEVLVHHHGVVDDDQLHAAGYSPAQIRQLLADRVLVAGAAGGSVFPDPGLYLDSLVLIQWRLPAGIFGGRTALLFYDLSVVWPVQIDVCVPADLLDGVYTEVPGELGVRPFTLPQDLRSYGVTHVYPSQPGDVPVAMSAPAVAVAQTLADPSSMEETREDGVITYVQDVGLDAALQEAAARYGGEARLQALIPPWL
jgi:hypothetical protein